MPIGDGTTVYDEICLLSLNVRLAGEMFTLMNLKVIETTDDCERAE